MLHPCHVKSVHDSKYQYRAEYKLIFDILQSVLMPLAFKHMYTRRIEYFSGTTGQDNRIYSIAFNNKYKYNYESICINICIHIDRNRETKRERVEIY